MKQVIASIAVCACCVQAAHGLDCGPAPEAELKNIIDSWWWRCAQAQSELLSLDRKSKYSPEVLRKLELRERMAWELYMGGKLSIDKLEEEFLRAQKLADKEMKPST